MNKQDSNVEDRVPVLLAEDCAAAAQNATRQLRLSDAALINQAAALNQQYRTALAAIHSKRQTDIEQINRRAQSELDMIDAERTRVAQAMNKAQVHFIGLGAAPFESEYKSRINARVTDKNLAKSASFDTFNSLVKDLGTQSELKGTIFDRIIASLVQYGGYMAAGLLIGGWILVSFDLGFWLAIFGTLGFTAMKRKLEEDDARNFVKLFVDAAAAASYLLDHEQRPAAQEKKRAAASAIERQYLSDKDVLDKSHSQRLDLLIEQWREKALAQHTSVDDITAPYRREALPWSADVDWSNWTPPDAVRVLRLGETHSVLEDTEDLSEARTAVVQHPNFVLPTRVPMLRSHASARSLLLEPDGSEDLQVFYGAARSILLRWLTATPPGKVMCTLIDPIGQGQNAAAFLSFGDHDEKLINSRVWTDARQIERKLLELTEHMETVIQKYLRAEYPSIQQYNLQAGEIAEPYRVVIVFDYPDSFTEAAVKQLERIVQNGARCGVTAIVVANPSRLQKYVDQLGPIRAHCESLDPDQSPDSPPPDELIQELVGRIGTRAKDALKVEVPYSKLMQMSGLAQMQVWQGSTVEGIRIPLGPGDARKPSYLELGVSLSVHALVIGRPGSGKSNLMHVVISTAVRNYGADELQLYLIDFKEGVEFKPYSQVELPSIPVIAIKSEREFGLSVLRKLDGMLKERADLFRQAGVNAYPDFRRQTNGRARLPRVLLIVDEFQEFFVRQDRLADEAALLLDRIVRQGRAFGIHLLLGSQTLSGYSLPRATLNLITVRIALQSSEADSRMILADDNAAARLLSRPGQAIYNASSGQVEGNAPFQVAVFTDEDRANVLAEVDAAVHALSSGERAQYPRPVVFEGHEPAQLARSVAFERSPGAHGVSTASPGLPVGEPIEIKPTTTVSLSTRPGGNVLVLDRDEPQGVATLTAAMLGLLLRSGSPAPRIWFLNMATAETDAHAVPQQVANSFPASVQQLDKRTLGPALRDLDAMVSTFLSDGRRPAERHALVIVGLQRVRDLRQEAPRSRFNFDASVAESSLPEVFARILREGPEAGIHVLAWCDTLAGFDRLGEPRLLSDFGIRLVGPMSAADSHKLLDDDAASKIDRPHRMIKFDEDRIGVLETFRPFALPEMAWIQQMSESATTNPRA